MLITVDFYRRTTGDGTTTDAEIADRVHEATLLLQDELDRWLIYAQYSETVLVHPDRRVYPKAYPVAVVVAGGEIDPEMDGRAIRSQDPDDVFFSAIGDAGTYRPTATIIYFGGYGDPDVGEAVLMPIPLSRCLAQLAYALYAPTPAGVVAGATAISLGDASITFANAASGLDELVPGISSTLRLYRRREYS